MILFLTLTLPWLLLCLHTWLNALLFQRLAHFKKPAPHQPKVSLLVPARNEEKTLPLLMPSLLAQNYPNLEILVLNDNSEDATQSILEGFSDPRLKLMMGGPLPEGWRGKPNACEQLAHASSGEILLFTDADTVWHKDATQLMVNALHHHRADAVSTWPEQILVGRISHLIQPFLAWSILALMPMVMINSRRFPNMNPASGQLFAYKRESYFKFGGFARVKTSILEDMECAKLLKKDGFRYKFLNGLGVVQCKMYNNDQEVLDGFSRNFFAVVNYQILPFIAAALGFFWVFVFPIIWFVLALFGVPIFGEANWQLALLTIVLMLLSTARSYAEFGNPIALALLVPLSALTWIRIAALSWYRFVKGQVTWKGRTYNLR